MNIWFLIFWAFWFIGGIFTLFLDAKENDWKWFITVSTARGWKNKTVGVISYIVIVAFSWVSVALWAFNDYDGIGTPTIFDE